MLGGSVRGGRVLGRYPSSLGEDATASRGRIIPTMSWEAVWHALATWFGVEQGQMRAVLPNLDNFVGCSDPGCGVLSTADVFREFI